MINYDAFADELNKILQKTAAEVPVQQVAQAASALHMSPKALGGLMLGSAALGAAGYRLGRRTLNDWMMGRTFRQQQQQQQY